MHAMRTRSCKSVLKSWSESARQRWSHSAGSRVTWSGASSTTCAISRCPTRLTRQLPMACTPRCAVHTSPAAKLRLVLSKHHTKEANAVPLSPFSESLRLRRRCARQFTVGTAVRKARIGLQGKLLPGSHIPIVSDAVLYAPQVCCPPIGACCCTSVHMLAWV